MIKINQKKKKKKKKKKKIITFLINLRHLARMFGYSC